MNYKNKIKSKTKTITVRQFLNLKIFVDRRFQRNACWKNPQQKRFMDALAQGLAITPLILADVKECMKYCMVQANLGKPESPAYKREMHDFQLVQQTTGCDKVSVDGQNRGSTLVDYYGDKFASDAFTGINGRAKVFSKLSADQQKRFLESEISVTTILQSTYTQLAEIFQAVNSGLPLNRMELRNAMNTPVAEFIRILAEDFFEEDLKGQSPRLLNLVESITSTRMKHLDTVLKTICFVHDSDLSTSVNQSVSLRGGQCSQNFGDTELDNFYRFGIGKGQSVCDINVYGEVFERRARGILSWLSKVVPVVYELDDDGKTTDKLARTTMPLYWALCGVYVELEAGRLPNLKKYSERSSDPYAIIFKVVSNAHIEAEAEAYEAISKAKNNGESASVRKKDYYSFYSTDVKDKTKRDDVLKELKKRIEDDAKSALRTNRHGLLGKA